MKNYRMLVPIVLIVLLVASWYLLTTNTEQQNAEYEGYLTEARRHAGNTVTKRALESYRMALDLQSSVDIYVEVADYLKTEGVKDEYLDWCKEFLDAYPTEVKAYEFILDSYVLQKDYESCFDIIIVAEKRQIRSDKIDEISNLIAFTFKLDFNSYDDVGVFSNNYCAIKRKEKWGFVDRFGKVRVSSKYKEVGSYTKSELTPVIDSVDNVYFIDKTGAKIMASTESYLRFGLIADDIFAAQRPDGKYVYLDLDFNVLHGEYDYATTMNYDVAAVQIGGAWKIIDKSGAELSATAYTDVIRDEKDIVYRNERLFVSLGDGYIMIDSAGNRIGTQVYEDAKLFSDTTYAAVKINGEWCFVDGSGALKSDKKYEDARSFMNGMAAVQVSGKWGFVDENEELKIAAEYDGAKDFNEKGSCFVKNGDIWQLLKLYRLNRKG